MTLWHLREYGGFPRTHMENKVTLCTFYKVVAASEKAVTLDHLQRMVGDKLYDRANKAADFMSWAGLTRELLKAMDGKGKASWLMKPY